MLQHAQANNARLLGVFPNGFALDAMHRPHITMVQCFVRTVDLDKVYTVAPFTVDTGTIAAFTAAHDDPAIDAQLIEYVSTFMPKKTGEHFSPHVTTGVAPRDYLDKMLAEPFEPFTFSPAGTAVYQLGPFGTAAKKLKAWDVKP